MYKLWGGFMAVILDSGNRRSFESGAVRDIQEGKGRCDLMPLDQISELLGINCPSIASIVHDIYEFMHSGDTSYLYQAISEFCNLYYDNMETAILELSKHYEAGALKYGERNWEKGIPLHSFIDSGIRHLLKFSRDDTDEPHDRAFIWNMLGAIWTIDSGNTQLIDIPFNIS